MGIGDNTRAISIRTEHLPLLKESRATKKYKETVRFDETHSYIHKVDYNPKLMRLLLSDKEYFRQLVESLCDPTYSHIEMPYCTFIDKCVIAKILEEECTGIKAIGIKQLKDKLAAIHKLTDIHSIEDYAPTHSMEVDGKQYTIATKDIIDFIHHDHTEIPYNKDSVKTIYGIDKKVFFYILKDFMAKYHISNTFILSDEAKRIVASINSDIEIDTYAFDKLNTTFDNIDTDITLDKDFVAHILDGIDTYKTDIEKAIYVYIKLCKTLCYDPEFYAENESDEINLLHTDPKTIEHVSLDRPNIVCYEFNAIYAQFLKTLGINYAIKAKNKLYAHGHASLIFRADDYIVGADSLTSIIASDLLNAKIGDTLNGISCQNKNSVMKNKFNNMVQSIYMDINEKESTSVTDKDTFRKLADMMIALNTSAPLVSISDRLDVFKELCANTKLPTIEKHSYLLTMFKQIFRDESTARLTLVSTKKDTTQEFFSPNMVISIREKPLGPIQNQLYNYLIYDEATDTWSPISKTKLLSMCHDNTLAMFGTHDIPGISKTEAKETFIDYAPVSYTYIDD